MKQMSPQDRQNFTQEMNKELDKVTLSWSKNLKEWYPHALKALETASPVSLQIPQQRYPDLLKQETHGLNMNVVAILCNNLEARTPKEMDMEVHEYAQVLELNQLIGKDWEGVCQPIRKTVEKRIELLAGKNNGAVLKPLIGEA